MYLSRQVGLAKDVKPYSGLFRFFFSVLLAVPLARSARDCHTQEHWQGKTSSQDAEVWEDVTANSRKSALLIHCVTVLQGGSADLLALCESSIPGHY